MTAEEDRHARLAAALRANLRRRKGAAPRGAPADTEPASPASAPPPKET